MCLQQDKEQEPRPKGVSVSSGSKPLEADEEKNVISYMAGYVPFKLLKAYKKKESEDAAAVVDCLSAMAQSGPDDFEDYKEEWTKTISRGGLFEVNSVTSAFPRRLDVAMRGLLSQQLLSGAMNRGIIVEAVLHDEDLIFIWAILSGQLSNEGSWSLLREIIDVWMTINFVVMPSQDNLSNNTSTTVERLRERRSHCDRR